MFAKEPGIEVGQSECELNLVEKRESADGKLIDM